jgi:hypothetical protein
LRLVCGGAVVVVCRVQRQQQQKLSAGRKCVDGISKVNENETRQEVEANNKKLNVSSCA